MTDTFTVSCSSSEGSGPLIMLDQGLSRDMAAYMLNLNMERGVYTRFTEMNLQGATGGEGGGGGGEEGRTESCR